MSAAGTDGSGFVAVCDVAVLQPERGVAALVDGHQVAIFRTFDGVLHALDNRDPFTGQNVLSRGIVGSRGDVSTVASPLLKQVFALETGVCVSDDSKRVTVHDVEQRDGVVHVRLRHPDGPHGSAGS